MGNTKAVTLSPFGRIIDVNPYKLSSFIAIVFLLSPSNYASETVFTLKEAIDLADQNSPSLKAQKARSDEARAVTNGYQNLPPPTVFFGLMGMNGLRSNGRMENSFGFSQMIPFPTKLTSEAKAKDFELEAEEEKLSGEQLRIYAETKSAFFDLFGSRETVNLLEEKKKIFREHNQRVRSITIADRIMQAHLLWIQTELDLVENELIVARETEKNSSGRLNTVMGIDPYTTIPPLEELPLSKMPDNSGGIPPSHPEVQSIEFSKLAATASVARAKSVWLPDFSVTYRNARRFDGVMPNYSELTIGVTLPFLFFWQANSQTSEASARVRESESLIEKTRNDLKLGLLEASTRAVSLQKQIANFETRIIPQSEKRMKMAHGLTPSDMESLTEHRDAMESVVKLKLSALTLRIEYEKVVARLESLLAVNQQKRRSP